MFGQIKFVQASVICGSVVAPLEDKTRPLEKDKATGERQGPRKKTRPLEKDKAPGERQGPRRKSRPLEKDKGPGERQGPWRKTKPLEKDKASGASEGLKPLSTGAATCSTAGFNATI